MPVDEGTVQEVLGVLDPNKLSFSLLFRTIFIFAVGLLVIRLIMRTVDRLMQLHKDVFGLHKQIRSIIRVSLWVLLILILLGSLEVDIAPLIALLSVMGLAVSLALQNTLTNLAGGMTILAAKPFQSGDYIQADGIEGTVDSIGLAYTRLTAFDGKRISVPNSQMSSAKIVNFTNHDEGRRVDLTFSASYNAPTQTVKQALQAVVDSIPQIKPDPAPVIWINAYQSSAIDYVVRVWTDSSDYWTVYYALMEGVRESFQKHGVEMTYNHLNVHLDSR